MRNSEYSKPRLDDSGAAAASLLGFGLRELVTSRSATSHVFQSPLHTGGNLRRQPSVILIDKLTSRILVLYACKKSGLDQLFRVDGPTVKTIRSDFKRFARGWVCAHLHEDSCDPVIEEWGFTHRARMELVRSYGMPLSASEQRVLGSLMGTEALEPA